MATKVPRRKSKWLTSDPEWEAMSAARSSMSHPAAAAAVAFLTEEYRKFWQPRAAGMVQYTEVIRVLQGKKISFVLTGAYGIAGWTGRPRSTHDVDILVKSGRNCTRAVNALRARYPQLEVCSLAGVTAFFLPGDPLSLLDVTYPHRADLQETLATAIWVEEHGLRFRVPTLECALANKYGAALTLTRRPDKRATDATDFYVMVQHASDPGRQPIDLDKLRELGEKVWPGGGGAEILRWVEGSRAGNVPNFNPPETPS